MQLKPNKLSLQVIQLNFSPQTVFFSGEMAGFGEIYGCVFASVYNVLSGAGGEDKVPGNRIWIYF